MKILTAIDFSDSTTPLLEAARLLMQGAANENKIWLLHAAEPDPAFVGFEAGPDTVRDTMAERYHREHRDLQSLSESLRKDGVDSTALLVQGPTVQTILDQAERLQADMVIAGTHGHGRVFDALLGSTSSELMRHSSKPTLIVPLTGTARK